MHEDNLKKVLEKGMKACDMVYTVLNTSVREHVLQNIQT